MCVCGGGGRGGEGREQKGEKGKQLLQSPRTCLLQELHNPCVAESRTNQFYRLVAVTPEIYIDVSSLNSPCPAARRISCAKCVCVCLGFGGRRERKKEEKETGKSHIWTKRTAGGIIQ